MNYCRKCQSDYDQPGTCNCFAPLSVTVTPYIPVTVPFVPYSPPTFPTYPSAVPWNPNYPTTIWGNAYPGYTPNTNERIYFNG